MAASVAQTLYYEKKFVIAAEQLTKLLADGPDMMEQKESIPLRLNLAISQFASSETNQRESATKVLFDAINDIVHSLLVRSDSNTNGTSTSSTELMATYSAAQIDTVLSALTPESFVTFFNFAALLFRYHQYESCRQVLERLVNFLDVEPQDSAASVRVCFLLLEVLLIVWNDCVVAHTEEQFSTFQSQAFHILSAAEQYILLTIHEVANKASIPPSLQSNVSTVSSVIDLSTIEFSGDPLLLLGNVLKYRIKLYRCRVNLAIGLLTEAESDITQALTIYDRVLRPIADNPSLITHIAVSSDTTNVDSSSSSSPASPTSSSSSLENHVTALASYLGGVNLHDVSDVVDQHVDVHLQKQLRIGLYVQGELHFRMGRYETSLSSLKQAANTGTWMINTTSNEELRGQWEGKELEYLNNAACIHMNQKRYHAACLFMQKAMIRMSSQPLSIDHEHTNVYQPTLSYVNAMGVIYNAGLACLHADNPYGAFQCFEKTIRELHARPILWLRMAECCIRYHTSPPSSSSSSSKSTASMKDPPKVIVNNDHSPHVKNDTITDCLLSPVTGLEGRGRRFVINLPEDDVEEDGVSSLGASGSRDKDATADGHVAIANDTNASNAMTTTKTTSEKHGCSIARASQYLNNALFLMRNVRATNKTSSLSETGSPLPNGDTHAVNYYPTGGSVGMDTLEVTALLQLSYVYLLQHNPVAALSASNEILSQSKLSEAGGHDTRVVAEMYTAEALCALGRVEEAVTLLQPQLTTESSAVSGSNGSLLSMKNVPNQWFLNSHCLLRYTTTSTTTGTTGNAIHEHQKRIHDMIVAVNNAAAISMSGGSGSQQLAKAQLLLEPVMKANPGFIPALRLMVYILLRRGKSADALALLRNREQS